MLLRASGDHLAIQADNTHRTQQRPPGSGSASDGPAMQDHAHAHSRSSGVGWISKSTGRFAARPVAAQAGPSVPAGRLDRIS